MSKKKKYLCLFWQTMFKANPWGIIIVSIISPDVCYNDILYACMCVCESVVLHFKGTSTPHNVEL